MGQDLQFSRIVCDGNELKQRTVHLLREIKNIQLNYFLYYFIITFYHSLICLTMKAKHNQR
jgi:hypothetical protein